MGLQGTGSNDIVVEDVFVPDYRTHKQTDGFLGDITKLAAGQEIELESRVLYRYQASLVIEQSMGLVDSLFSSAGGSSVFQGSEIQQRFLDIHTARAHVANNPTSFARNLGALTLGADNADFFV